MEQLKMKKSFQKFETEKIFSHTKKISFDLAEAIKDSREQKNLYGPFETAKDAVKSMLED